MRGDMSVSLDMSLLNAMLDKIAEVANDIILDVPDWVDHLSDMEKVFFMAVFIALLFFLILVKAANRKHTPKKGRSFVSSIVLVMLFSFGAGWMLDSRFALHHMLNFG